MAIKKAYQGIIAFLKDHSDHKVKSILDEVIAMASAKTGGGARAASTVKYDADGNVVAIFCYYHKKWEDPSVVEYGARASAQSGLNNMCKEGTSQWTKQQRAAKGAQNDLLIDVLSGECTTEEASAMKDDIESMRSAVIPREDGHFVDFPEDEAVAVA